MGKALKEGLERDRYMDLVLLGKTPSQIAETLGWSLARVREGFRAAFYPDEPYRPTGKRMNREGKPMTQLELKIAECHAKAGVPAAHTARMLARAPEEVDPNYFDAFPGAPPEEDLLYAHKFLYHCSSKQIISDDEYDRRVQRLLDGKVGKVVSFLHDPKKVELYPAHVRALAYYMLYKFMEATGEWDDDALPYAWGKERKKTE